MVLGSLEDLSSFVLNSKYRQHVVVGLARTGPTTPTELAADTDLQRSHISRAVSELRDSDIVDLQVADERTVGRYYDLTETGEKVWEIVRVELDEISWEREAPSTDLDAAILETARAELGDRLRFFGKYDGQRAVLLYVAPDAGAEYTDAELDAGIREVVHRRLDMNLEVPGKQCWSQVFFFESETIIMVQLDGGTLYSVTFDMDDDVEVIAICRSIREEITSEWNGSD